MRQNREIWGDSHPFLSFFVVLNHDKAFNYPADPIYYLPILSYSPPFSHLFWYYGMAFLTCNVVWWRLLWYGLISFKKRKNTFRLVFELSVAKLSTYVLKILVDTILCSRYCEIHRKIPESIELTEPNTRSTNSDVETKCWQRPKWSKCDSGNPYLLRL